MKAVAPACIGRISVTRWGGRQMRELWWLLEAPLLPRLRRGASACERCMLGPGATERSADWSWTELRATVDRQGISISM